MKTQRPSQITTKHLNRRAIEYRRRATLPQTGEAGSVTYQATQARVARRWGWPERAIQVIDENPGGNGSTMENRPGYHRLCEQIAQGEVGVVLVTDVSRVTRSFQVWQQFMALCRQHATLIAVNGVVFDDAYETKDFRRHLRSLIIGYERSLRVARGYWAKRAKASGSKRKA